MPTEFWHYASCEQYSGGIHLHFNTGAPLDNPYPTTVSIGFLAGKVCKTIWQTI